MKTVLLRDAKTLYRNQGLWELLRVGSSYGITRCKELPFLRSISKRRRLTKLMKTRPLKLHLGCGALRLEGYVNIDRFNSRADLISDAVSLKVPTNSVDEIFTSHMIEHITYSEFVKALKEWKRVLREKAELVIRCPNFEKHLKDWLNGSYQTRWRENNYGVNVILGFQDKGPGYPNRNIFTRKRLIDLVGRAGFEIINCHPVASRSGEIPEADLLLRACKPTFTPMISKGSAQKLGKGPLRLHLGCGRAYLGGYVNVDIEDWAKTCDLVADATYLYMFGSNSVDHILSHALLEHIPPWATDRTLREWYRVLKPGGTVEIEVPDLERVFQDWLVEGTLGEQEAINNLYGGNKLPDKPYQFRDHLTGFTYKRLTKMMARCGFTDFKRREHSEYHHILIVWARKGEE